MVKMLSYKITLDHEVNQLMPLLVNKGVIQLTNLFFRAHVFDSLDRE